MERVGGRQTVRRAKRSCASPFSILNSPSSPPEGCESDTRGGSCRMKSSRIALVTGANKGIGFEVARELARMRFHVYLGARNPEAGRAAAEQLSADGNVTFLEIDVSKPDSIHRAAEEFSARPIGSMSSSTMPASSLTATKTSSRSRPKFSRTRCARTRLARSSSRRPSWRSFAKAKRPGS